MPCYLFTYHGHGTWLPDRKQGYVKRKVGVLPQDIVMAENYHRNQQQTTVEFDEKLQSLLIDGIRSACEMIEVRCHCIATDKSHLHLLLSWKSVRTYQSVTRAIKSSLSRRLNEKFGHRQWFSKGSSRKRVKDRQHFDHLMEKYLPNHRGTFFREKTGDA